MSGTWGFKPLFLKEFQNFPTDQQDAIYDFTDLVEAGALGNFGLFPGKTSQSWSGLIPSDPAYQFAFNNNLWHYHVGIPTYRQVHSKFKTSDWVLHFQWDGWNSGGRHVVLVDCYQHYKADGTFYMPSPNYLVDEQP